MGKPARELHIGIIGIGVVGSSVVEILRKNRELITARTGVEITVKRGVVRDLNKARACTIPLTDNVDEVLYDESIDVVVELMGGRELPYQIAKTALAQGKAFVTANKAMLAYHRYELASMAKTPIGFEASVCGGIPIINALKVGLSANEILAIRGILNGTSNYILTKMAQDGWDFAQALQQAQNLGYAEANPSLDIDGYDAAHKLLILASIAYGIKAAPEEILVEGISDVAPEDIEFAKEFGYCIKLLGIAKKHGNEIELRVHPTMIDEEKLLADVDGVMNAVSVVGDCTGESVYYGAGAGGNPTASSVISDLIAIARSYHISQSLQPSAMLGFITEQQYNITPKEQIKSKYYMRILADDKHGVLEKITAILSKNAISISTFLQKPQKPAHTDSAPSQISSIGGLNQPECAKILLATHETSELAIQNAIKGLQALESVRQRPVIIRIEE